MKTLMIADLAHTDTLDAKAMASVRGGMYKGLYPVPLPTWGMSSHEFSLDATQVIGQTQNVVNENGNNVAFAAGITSTIKPTQTANNNINF
ncbi:MAG TPA: hypothetical protein VEC06_21180 [Paucimonas sp.]|nr:hypothetical protein [Paucimonas sp.]